jgi:hydrogenase expression/formation protein HypD
MKYIDEFRNAKLVNKLAAKICRITPAKNLNIMEVCGTHTQNFYRFGLDSLLPENINLISGPGCPVCVSSQEYIDAAIDLVRKDDFIIVTFGDMLHVPGTSSSLEKERAKFGNVRVVYSPLDALSIAKANPNKKVVFLGVGFETTAPVVALSIIAAKKEKINNLFFLTSLKLIPPALKHLLTDKRLKLDGFLCPGHVSVIIGAKSYAFIPKKYRIACSVTGFEPVDLLEGIAEVIGQVVSKKPFVANQYFRVVTSQGNLEAQHIINKVFKVVDSGWRGLGVIGKSGLGIRNEFKQLDAARFLPVSTSAKKLKFALKCRCADVLKGLIRPTECSLFRRVCKPDNPIGPCMVSSEGACNAFYKYKRKK